MSSMSAIRDPISRGVANHEMEISSSEKEEESGLDRVSLLPNELAVAVFSNLGPQDLATSSKGCRRWRDLADADILWKEFIEDKEIDISGTSVKEYIAKQCPIPGAIFCRSHEVVLQKLEDFFRNIPEGQKGRFRVILSQRNEEITFEHGIVDKMVDKMRSPDRDPRFIKTCFLIHNKIDPGVIYSHDMSLSYSNSPFDNRELAGYSGYKYIFYRSDLVTRIEKSIEKFNTIGDEKVKKFGNEPRKSLFKRMINYCNESRITLVIGVALGVLGSYLINNNQ